MQNIDRFNILTAHILAQLYERFPETHDLDIAAIASKMGVGLQGAFVSEVGGRRRYAQAVEAENAWFTTYVLASLAWLRDEGFIKASSSDALRGVILTSRGFSVLASQPDVLKTPLGQQLVGAAKDGASSILSDLVGQTIGGFFKAVAS